MTAARFLAASALAVALAACGGDLRYDPLPAGTTVVAFGDSVTHGVGAEAGEDWPSRLAERTGWTIVNAGISGDTADEARGRIAEVLEEHRPRLVIVEIGGNDFLRRTPSAQVKEYLREILVAVKDSGAIPVLVGVPELSLFSAAVGNLSDSPIYEELSEEEDILLIPDVFSDTLSDEALRDDRIHPNAAGYTRMADEMADALYDAGLLSSIR